MCRYKHGPWRRVVVAITHLDTSRDTAPYTSDIAYYSNFKPHTPMLWDDDEGAEALLDGADASHAHAQTAQDSGIPGPMVTNPLMAQLRQQRARKALQWGPLPRQPLLQGSRLPTAAVSSPH